MAPVLFTLFCACLLLGIPVAMTMGIAGLGAMLYDGSLTPLLAMQRIYAGIDSFPLMAVPFFILASELMSAFGLTNSLLSLANNLVGHIRGGLGHVNVLISMFFAGISGSALADAAGPSAIVMRMMRKAGYDKYYAGALSAATATIGPIIPPSILMVIYAISDSKVTVAGLFLAGIVPGLMLGGAFALTNMIISIRRGYRGREHRATLPELARSLVLAIPALIMPILILGGILGGVFTPTEAGVVASAYALLLGIIARKATIRRMMDVLVQTSITTSSVLLIVAMASIFAWLLAYLRIPQEIGLYLGSISENPLTILLILAGFTLACGMFIDTLPALIILTPVLAPVAYQFGIDPHHFAMMLVLNLAIGMVTPPIGPVLFVISAVGDLRPELLAKAVMPLLFAALCVLLLVILVPELSTTMPTLFGY